MFSFLLVEENATLLSVVLCIRALELQAFAVFSDFDQSIRLVRINCSNETVNKKKQLTTMSEYKKKLIYSDG